MKRSTPILAALAALLALVATPPAPAGGAIQHCRSAEGVPVYTDRGCSALGARPVPMPDALVRRIASSGSNPAYIAPRSTVPTRRASASGCARTATQLASDLHSAFALGDVNRISESYHWVGLSHRQGQQVMERLERLSGRSLLAAHYFDARIRSGWMQVADARAGLESNGGMMQLVFGEGHASSALDLDVRRYQGCFFVRFP